MRKIYEKPEVEVFVLAPKDSVYAANEGDVGQPESGGTTSESGDVVEQGSGNGMWW